MNYLLKKYKFLIIIALLINIPLLCLGTIRTNKQILLKGDTTIVSSLINVETNNYEQGSFSTIYVVSVNHSTLLHNILAKLVSSADISDMSKSSLHYTDIELLTANKIMYESARQASLICAYNKAQNVESNYHLEYSYKGVKITAYKENSSFKIGDLIYKFYDCETNMYYDCSNYNTFINVLNNLQSEGDIIYYINDSNLKELRLSNSLIKSFSGYSIYNIDFSLSDFNVNYKSTNIGGPSGGLLQALEIFNKLTKNDYSFGLQITGTGTINQNGNVGIIGGIKQKIYTAFDDNKDVFFCPSGNYEEALEAYNKLNNKERMALISVDTFDDAISYLVGRINA